MHTNFMQKTRVLNLSPNLVPKIITSISTVYYTRQRKLNLPLENVSARITYKHSVLYITVISYNIHKNITSFVFHAVDLNHDGIVYFGHQP